MGHWAAPGAGPNQLSWKRVLVAALLLVVPGTFGVQRGMGTSAAQAQAHARVIGTLHVGRRPEPAIADPQHHRVYVGVESGGEIAVVDDRTNAIVRTVTVGHEVEDLALDNAAGRLYSVNRNSSSVAVVDTAGLRVVHRVHVPPSAGIALDPSRHRLFLASSSSGLVTAVSTESSRVVHEIRVGRAPQGIAVDRSTHRLYVGMFNRGVVLVIDGFSHRLLGTVRVGRLPAHPLRLDELRGQLYAVNEGSSTLSVISTRSMRTVRTVSTGSHPEGVDISPDGRFAYVSNEGDPGTDKNSGDTVSVIDLRAGRVVDTVKVELGPDAVAYDAATGRLYVCDENPGDVSVVQLPPEER